MPSALEKKTFGPNSMAPDFGTRRPAMAVKSVDLPVPLRPQRTVRRPDGNSALHPSSTTRPSRSTLQLTNDEVSHAGPIEALDPRRRGSR